MKNFIYFIIFVTLLTSYIKCGAIEKQVDESEPKTESTDNQPNFIEKIKVKATDFIGKVQQGSEVAVQKLKSGFQETKCRLHQVREKYQHHTHEHNPCGEDADVDENQGQGPVQGNPNPQNKHDENNSNNPKIDEPKDNKHEKPTGRRTGSEGNLFLKKVLLELRSPI